MFAILLAQAVATTPPAVIGTLQWIRKPTGDDFARLYPRLAVMRNLNGRVLLECRVADAGDLTACSVLAENPVDVGFGEATVKLAERF